MFYILNEEVQRKEIVEIRKIIDSNDNSWLVFNGQYWQRDDTRKVHQFAKKTARAIHREVSGENDDMRQKILKHALYSESNAGISLMLERAKSELPVMPDQFDTHIHLLNFTNGTFNLETGVLSAHKSEDMIAKCAGGAYNKDATCPEWLRFLDIIFKGDQELIDYMQMALGMSLSGDTSEECFFIGYGLGSNGKTTAFNQISQDLGDYAMTANITTFQSQKSDSARFDTAEFFGARFALASENKIGSRLDESFIKKATGKEKWRGAHKHEREFEFTPEFTLWLNVNHKPEIKDPTHAMWRRVKLIPFTHTFEGNDVDIHYADKLTVEREGRLAWLVEGHMKWRAQGKLIEPRAVTDATQEYRKDMDTFSGFIADECTLLPRYKAVVSEVKKRYENWCEEQSEKCDLSDFKRGMANLGIKSKRGAHGTYVYSGIGLKDNGATPSSDTRTFSNFVDENKKGDVSDAVAKNNSYTHAREKNLQTTSLTSLTSPQNEAMAATLRALDDYDDVDAHDDITDVANN